MAKKKAKSKSPKTKADSYGKFWCIWNGVEALIILVAGVLSIVFGILYKSGEGNGTHIIINNVLPFVVGTFVCMDAILRIVKAVQRIGKETEESIMLIGGFELTAGILVMMFHDIFTRLIISAIAVLLIVVGALLLLFSIMVIIKRSKKLFIPILEIIFAAILVGVGTVVLILYHTSSDNNQIVLIVSGIIFTILGLGQGILTIIKAVKLSKGKVVVKDNEEPTVEPVEEPVAIEAEEETPLLEKPEKPKEIEDK